MVRASAGVLCLVLGVGIATAGEFAGEPVETPPSGVGTAEVESGDPLRSPGWHLMEDRWFKGADVRHDERVQVLAPAGAEDSTAVPGFVRVHGIEDIQRLLVFADLNPIPRVLEMSGFAESGVLPTVGFSFKVQQATPLRAAVQTTDGAWYVGGTWVDAAGGGCSAPSIASAQDGWESRLGEFRGRRWQGARADSDRVTFSVVHPMDTGLAPGIPEFHVEEVEVVGEDGGVLARMEIDASMSENPQLTLEAPGGERLVIRARDNNGNRFAGVVK